MKKSRFRKRLAVAAGFFFLYAAPGLTRAQSSPPSPAPTPQTASSPAAQPKKDTPPTDDFAGLTLTDDQKARIDKIHQDMKTRVDAVVKNRKITAEQRDGMLEGYRRAERSQVFKVLTAAQQKEVLRRAQARRAEELKQQPAPN